MAAMNLEAHLQNLNQKTLNCEIEKVVQELLQRYVEWDS